MTKSTTNMTATTKKTTKKTTEKTTQKNIVKVLPIEDVEQEQLFGSQVDHYVAMNCCQILGRVFKKATMQEVKNDDIWESAAKYLKRAEMQGMLEALIPSKEKQTELVHECGGYSRRNASASVPMDRMLDHLYRELQNRKYIWQALADIMDARVQEYNAIIQSKDFKPRTIQLRMAELQNCMGLTDKERDILMVCFLEGCGYIALGDFGYSVHVRICNLHRLAVAAGVDEYQMETYLDVDSTLRKYDIIDDDGELDRTFVCFLRGTSQRALSERFWSKSTEEVLPWEFHGKIATEHGKVLVDMIHAKPAEKGCSILLYGTAGAGKTSFAMSLAAKMGRELYFIAQNEKRSRSREYSITFRFAALAAAQRKLDPDKSILVIDECDAMIEAGPAARYEMNAWRDGAALKSQLNTAIDENRHVVIWICNSQQSSIASSSRRRFDYSVLFDELLPETRVHIWENCLKKENCVGKLSNEFIKEVSWKYKVNAGGIALAVKNAAAMIATYPKKSFEECVSTFLKAHCELMGIHKSSDERINPAKDYSLEGLNIKSGIHPERIIQVCRNFLKAAGKAGREGRDKPRMNLLLHGVPGSGKTEFVKYLAMQLGKKLNIKNASDLLSMWLGGTEHLLALAFAEAEKNKEILFIDEGDSMLASRNNATHTWEVSQVNTLLTEMENFNGIFIVSTNLIQRLDPAALRRFTFRIHFDFLENEGKETFYRTYFGPLHAPELTEADKAALHAIEKLTPSDFRNVRQQLFYLDNAELTATEIIEALKQEAQTRDSYDSYKGLGEEKHNIGFNGR